MATRRILLIDDDPLVRGVLGRTLARLGCDVAVVGSPHEGLARATSEEFDAVITDLALPGLDGISLAGRLGESGTAAPIGLVTGHGLDDGTRVRAQSAGVRAILPKPFTVDDVRRFLERLLPA